MLNYYEILGITRTANATEIKAAFKKLAIQHHPDKNPNNKIAEEKFKLVNEAYQVLQDDYKRALYDQRLLYKEEVRSYHTAPPPARSNYPPSARKMYSYKRRAASGNFANLPKVHLLALGSFLIVVILFSLCYRLIGVYQSKNEYQAALLFYKNGEYKESFAKAHEAVLQDDKNMSAYYLRGLLLLNHLNDPQQAVNCFTRCLTYGRHITEKDSENLGGLADFYLQRGICFYKTGSYTNAIDDLQHTLQLRPKDEIAWLYLGHTYLYKRNDFAPAYTYYSKILDQNPNNIDALLGKSIVLFHHNHFNKAAKGFEKILQQNPDNPKACYYMGRYFLTQKDSAKGCEYLQLAKELGVEEAEDMLKRFNKLCTTVKTVGNL
jgi:curved DNA-binding protein CbpA